jgi:rhodanese-related sulfurtransferase
MLRQLQIPVILHVKFDLDSKDYNHWVLFMGSEGGKARIYDRDLCVTEISFNELAARWDGNGLLVSNSPIDRTRIWLTAACPFLVYLGMAAFVVGLLSRRKQNLAGASARASWTSGVRSSLRQSVGLIIIALGALGSYRLSNPAGFLSSQPAIAAIQDSHFGSFLPKVKTEEMTQLLDMPGVSVVDARLPNDFKAGHLKGAINVPVGSNPKQCQEAMASVPKEFRIVVYSHSNGCPYGGQVAKKLFALGYRNILLFNGGWVEWEKYHTLR